MAALEVTIAAYGAEHTEVARVLLNLARAEARAGNADDAITRWWEALAMRARLLIAQHPDLAIILQNIGQRGDRARPRSATVTVVDSWVIAVMVAHDNVLLVGFADFWGSLLRASGSEGLRPFEPSFGRTSRLRRPLGKSEARHFAGTKRHAPKRPEAC